MLFAQALYGNHADTVRTTKLQPCISGCMTWVGLLGPMPLHRSSLTWAHTIQRFRRVNYVLPTVGFPGYLELRMHWVLAPDVGIKRLLDFPPNMVWKALLPAPLLSAQALRECCPVGYYCPWGFPETRRTYGNWQAENRPCSGSTLALHDLSLHFLLQHTIICSSGGHSPSILPFEI